VRLTTSRKTNYLKDQDKNSGTVTEIELRTLLGNLLRSREDAGSNHGPTWALPLCTQTTARYFHKLGHDRLSVWSHDDSVGMAKGQPRIHGSIPYRGKRIPASCPKRSWGLSSS
jgi:hypothetical protein